MSKGGGISINVFVYSADKGTYGKGRGMWVGSK